MKPWQRTGETKVNKVSYRTIVTKQFVMPNGETAEFGTIAPEGQEFVAVIALTERNEVVVARQFRVGPELMMDELPGGFVDPGETVEAAGIRELHEETGYKAGKIEYLGKTHKDAYMNAVWHFILATECVLDSDPDSDKTHAAEAEEHVEVLKISIDELIENAKHDRMTDAVGVLIAYDKLVELASEAKK